MGTTNSQQQALLLTALPNISKRLQQHFLRFIFKRFFVFIFHLFFSVFSAHMQRPWARFALLVNYLLEIMLDFFYFLLHSLLNSKRSLCYSMWVYLVNTAGTKHMYFMHVYCCCCCCCLFFYVHFLCSVAFSKAIFFDLMKFFSFVSLIFFLLKLQNIYFVFLHSVY